MFRFTIRDLPWLMVVAFVFAAWLADRSRLTIKLEQNHAAAKMLAQKLIDKGGVQGFWIPGK
jgi:hypothetical protein